MTPEQAKQKLAELEAQKQELLEIINSRYTPEKRFLGLINGLEIKLHPEHSDSIYFFKEGKYFVQLDLKNKRIWFIYSNFWSILQKEFRLNHDEIQQLLKTLLEKHFKLMGFTPAWFLRLHPVNWRSISN